LFAGVLLCLSSVLVAQHEKSFSTEQDPGHQVTNLDRLTEAVTRIAGKFQELSQELVQIARKWLSKGKDALNSLKRRLSEFNAKMQRWTEAKKQKWDERSKDFKAKMRQNLGKLKEWASDAPQEDQDYRFGDLFLRSAVKKTLDFFKLEDARAPASGACSESEKSEEAGNELLHQQAAMRSLKPSQLQDRAAAAGATHDEIAQALDDEQDSKAALITLVLAKEQEEKSKSIGNKKADIRQETSRTDVEGRFHDEVNRLVDILRTGAHMYDDLDKLGAAEDLQRIKDDLHNNYMEAVLEALQALNEFCGNDSQSYDVDVLLELFKAAGAKKPEIVLQLIGNTVDALDNARVDARHGPAFCKQDLKADDQSMDGCVSKVCSNIHKILRTFGAYMRSKRQ
jgi:hypothetical protein